MLKKVIFLLFLANYAFSQSQEIDSLEKLLPLQQDSLKILTLTELIWQFRNTDADKAIKYGKEGLFMAKQGGYHTLKPKLLNYIGVAYRNRGDYEDALQSFIQTVTVAEAVNNQEQLGYAYQSLGDLSSRQGNYNQAEAYVLRGLTVFQRINNMRGVAYCYYSMGAIHNNKKEYFVAEQYYLKCLELRKKENNIVGIASCYGQLSVIKQNQDNLDEALAYSYKAYELVAEQDFRGKSILQHNLGKIFFKKKNYTSAITAVEISLEYAEKSRNLEYIKQNYRLLSDIYASFGAYQKAYSYQNKFFVYGDSIFNQQKERQLAELREKFNSEKNILNIQSLTEKNRLQNILLVILVVLVLLLVAFAIYSSYTRNKQKETTLKAEIQTRQIQKQNFELTNLNEEITLRNQISEYQNQHLTHLTQVQNKLFSVISHDFRNPLVSLYNSLLVFESDDFSAKEKKTALDALKTELTQTSNLLDNLLYWTAGQMKGNNQLNKIQFDCAEIINETFVLLQPQADRKKITLSIYQEKSFMVFADKEMIKIVLRNLVHNAIKYSYPHGIVIVNILISKHYAKQATIIVKDSGQGIDKENQAKLFGLAHYSTTGTNYEKGSGVGLLLCKDFIEKNNGKIWVESEPNQGATFCFTLPITEN
jgi:two-component system sensor histidine kinase/response regulator